MLISSGILFLVVVQAVNLSSFPQSAGVPEDSFVFLIFLGSSAKLPFSSCHLTALFAVGELRARYKFLLANLPFC